MRAVEAVPLNRYPDPLANEVRDSLAQEFGLARDQVLVGNGGDELLFNVALAWGGPGRTFLNLPPTFSVYEANARPYGHDGVVNVPRREDFSLDEQAVLARVSQGDVDCIILTSPNNPTGQCVPEEFVRELLDATDALVLVDEAVWVSFQDAAWCRCLPSTAICWCCVRFRKRTGLRVRAWAMSWGILR